VTPTEMDALKLPYPVIAAEFRSTMKAKSGTSSSKRIALAFDLDEVSLRSVFMGDNTVPEHSTLIWPIWFDNSDKRWVPGRSGVVIERGGDSVSKIGREVLIKSQFIDIPLDKSKGYVEMTDQQKVTDASTEIAAIAQLCGVLNCSNITPKVVKPRGRFWQTASSKKKKRKLYEYHVLEVDGGGAVGVDHSSTHGNSRCGPRVHLRRGHIRGIGDGRTTWVKPCVVGNKADGVVMKSYSVKR